MKDSFGDNSDKNFNENVTNAVYTFDGKGVNQGVNRRNKVETKDNFNNTNNLQQSVKWITVSEGVNQLGITKMAIVKHISKGHFVTRRVKMKGGFGYEIALESVFNYYNKIGDWGKCEKILQLLMNNPLANGELTIPSVVRTSKNEESELNERVLSDPSVVRTSEAMAKYQVCRLLDEVIMKADKKTIAVERFVNSFNPNNSLKSVNFVKVIEIK